MVRFDRWIDRLYSFERYETALQRVSNFDKWNWSEESSEVHK